MEGTIRPKTIIFALLGVLIIGVAFWLAFRGGSEISQTKTQTTSGPTTPTVPSDQVNQLTDDTTASAIESDLDFLSDEEKALGDLDAEIQKLEQELDAGL